MAEREQERQQFIDETQQPYAAGEFLSEASRLTRAASYIEQVHWDSQTAAERLLLSRASAVMRQASASLLRADWVLSQAQHAANPATEVTREPGQAQPVAPAPGSTTEAQTDNEQSRVTLTGRVVRTPEFKTIPKGRKRLGFELAEHHEDGTTTYHTVYSLDAYAERAFKKGLHKGDLVELRGTRQMHEVVAKDGTTKLVEQVYCYGITKR